MTLLFSSFLFIISKFYISTIIVKIQLNDTTFKNQQVWLLRSFATDCHRLASTKLFSFVKPLYHNDRITIINVTWHKPYLSKFNSNTLLIVQYSKSELCSYQINHFLWLTLLNLQAIPKSVFGYSENFFLWK
jgi:hypothetical protein